MEFDLLGDPIPEGWAKRGRPPHVPTEEKRKIVMSLAAFDWSMEKIAAALSITPPTLRKFYFRELQAKAEARARVEGGAIAALVEQALAGNVQAIDKLLKRLDKRDLDKLADAAANRGRREPAVGKKEAAMQAAASVRGKFAPPPAPGSALN